MKLNAFLIKSTLVAALGGLLFGFDTAVIAGTTATLTDLFHLSPKLLGVTVGSALWGTILGAAFAGIPGDRFGRRDSLRGMAVLYLISALGCALAWDWYSLLFFRFVGGLGVGGSSVLGPMYIAEIAPPNWRGRLVSFFQFNVVFGILLAYFSNYLVGLAALGDAEWRWKLGVSALPALLFLLLLFFIARSPRWLASKGRMTEAREVMKMTGDPQYEQHLSDIEQALVKERSQGKESLFSPKYRLPVFLAVSIGLFNQLLGINAILYYLNDIFAFAGFNKLSGDLQSVAIGVANLCATMLAMSVIDKVGRKTLLLIGSVGTAICMAGVAFIFLTKQHQNALVWLLIGYIGFFSFSQGAVIWVYISEVFPNSVRAKGQSLGSLSHWFMNAVIAGVFPYMAAQSGAYPFFFFALMAVAQFFVVLSVYPETKGVSLEELQYRLKVS